MPTFSGKVILDPVAVAKYLRGPQGPVLRRFLEDAQEIKRLARIQVGVHEPTPGERRKRAPGTLRDSLVVRIVAGVRPTVIVGSDDPIAKLHHEGTDPHIIRARRAPMLVFFWKKVGRVVAFKQVRHPGTRPNHYLTDPLRKVISQRY